MITLLEKNIRILGKAVIQILNCKSNGRSLRIKSEVYVFHGLIRFCYMNMTSNAK